MMQKIYKPGQLITVKDDNGHKYILRAKYDHTKRQACKICAADYIKSLCKNAPCLSIGFWGYFILVKELSSSSKVSSK